MDLACNNFFIAEVFFFFFVRKFFFFILKKFLAVLGLCCCVGFFLVAASRACSLVAVHRLLTAVASLTVEQACRACRLQSLRLLVSRAQAQ